MFKIVYYNISKCIAQSCPAVVHHSHLATARELKIFQIHMKIFVKIAAKTSRQNLGNNSMLIVESLTTQQSFCMISQKQLPMQKKQAVFIK